jgi:hypothetical protein
MYREILIPTEKSHSIELPPSLYGKKVEVIAFEIDPQKITSEKKKQFLDDIVPIPDFPSVEQIRKEAWPEKT